MPRRKLSNWGLYPEVEANFYEPADVEAVVESVEPRRNLIARGNGRCYGDSSLAENIVSTLRLNRIVSFDQHSGIIECESGVLFSEILSLAVPSGFFLPVTPGTKYVTVGGAIAADVHGKNHHSEGSFSQHVIEMWLLTEAGNIINCSPERESDLFWSTCGGMGLTGIILRAKFKLKPIKTSYVRQVSLKARDIEQVMRLFERHADATYSVAWIDCFAGGRNFGRSILILGEHARPLHLPKRYRSNPLVLPNQGRMNVNFFFPSFVLSRITAKAFNFLYYHKHMAARSEAVVHFDTYFYPLDRVRNWNRIYGRNGFLQYQFVLPKETSYEGLGEVLGKVSASGEGSPLAVLKLLGAPPPETVMSFPIEGYTLALDFKLSDRVFKLLDILDEIVLKYKGRIYLAKDARLSRRIFDATYEKRVSSGKFRSCQAERLAI